MTSPRVIVLGNANIDLTSYVDAFPANGETVLSTGFFLGLGGKGANQAVASARAGSPTALIGAIGRDTFGEEVWDGLANESLTLDHLHRFDTPTGTATIMVDPSGTNRIAVFVGASGMVTPEHATAAISEMADAKFFVSQLEISAEAVSHAIRHAKDLGMTTVVNTAPYRPLNPDLLRATDWIIANEIEAQALLDDIGIDGEVGGEPENILTQLSSWSTMLGTNLIITLGAQGAVGCMFGETPAHSSAPPVTAVDTVGAGDCFTGFFVALLDQGCDWSQAMTGAVHAASQSVQSPGAQSSYPPHSDADVFVQIARQSDTLHSHRPGVL
jgi:ribokinase